VLDESDAATRSCRRILANRATRGRLAIGRGIRWLPGIDHAQQITEKITVLILRREFANGLESELLQTLESVRKIYERVMA
jgi:hypothetical protein